MHEILLKHLLKNEIYSDVHYPFRWLRLVLAFQTKKNFMVDRFAFALVLALSPGFAMATANTGIPGGTRGTLGTLPNSAYPTDASSGPTTIPTPQIPYDITNGTGALGASNSIGASAGNTLLAHSNDPSIQSGDNTRGYPSAPTEITGEILKQMGGKTTAD